LVEGGCLRWGAGEGGLEVEEEAEAEEAEEAEEEGMKTADL
jgi:hypothetical protein